MSGACPRCGSRLRVSPKGTAYCPSLACRWPNAIPVVAPKLRVPIATIAAYILTPIGAAGVLWVVGGFAWIVYFQHIFDPLPKGVRYRVEEVWGRRIVTLRVSDPNLSERQCRRLIEHNWLLTRGQGGRVVVEKPLHDGQYLAFCVNNNLDSAQFRRDKTIVHSDTFDSEVFNPRN